MSQDQAIQITAHAPQILMQKIELALDQHTPLEGLTYSLIEEDEAAKIWRLDMFPKDDEDVVNAKAFLKTFPDLIVTTDILADADWLALALSGLPPVRAGRFFIYGAHDLGRVPQNAKALRIEAGAAFGTGHHATTTGCLLAYHKLLKASSYNRVLDIGTGTGILALAAASMRTKTVVGTDIDPIAVRVAKENAKLNQLQARFVKAFGLKSKSVTHKAPYDLVFANILAPPLIALAPDIFSVLKPEGLVILSGLLRHQERAVAASYRARGFIYLSRVRQNPWVTLVFKRKA